MKYGKILVPLLAATLFAAPALAGAVKGYEKKVAAGSKATQVSAEKGKKCPMMKSAGHHGDASGHHRDHVAHSEHIHN